MIAASPVRGTFELEASHSPFMSKPKELAETLLRIASDQTVSTNAAVPYLGNAEFLAEGRGT